MRLRWYLQEDHFESRGRVCHAARSLYSLGKRRSHSNVLAMSGSGVTLAHRSVASIRGGAPQGQTAPSTPQTPPRHSISTYGSPSTIRADDDIILIELGSRFLRVGFGGDSVPKATLSCGPEDQRRVGDFRTWQQPDDVGGSAWSAEHEIWHYDLRETDLGLVGDKLDRMLRDAFSKYASRKPPNSLVQC